MSYNEIFVEEIIRRRRKGRELTLKLGIIAAALILVVVSFLFLYAYGFFATAFALICILVFFAFHYTRCEFEYSFMGGELHIDKITGKRHRKRVYSGDVRDIVKFGRCTAENKAEYTGEFKAKVDAAVVGDTDKCFFTARSADGDETLVIFSPSARLRAAFLAGVPKRRVIGDVGADGGPDNM